MPQPTVRKLAAIVSTDVVGYSRLIGADETGTLARMKAYRQELWIPEIEKHGGRIVGTAGDSLLVEFASAVSAVECSLAVQQGMARREAEQPDDTRMLLRIGVNIGEVVVDGDDIHGDGVNIAARLQAIAPVGGICLSGKVHDEVDGKVAAVFTDQGEHEAKNIARPVHVWQWVGDTAPAVAGTSSNRDEPLSLPDKPSIAVLPFDNMSGDPEQAYFADGIAEDVITDLSKVSGLLVIARNSSFGYRGQSPDIRKVCRELGVRYVLEGSVRKGGRRVRINAQLIDGSNGAHVWADRFDRDLEDIFEVQDDVTREIVQALRVALTPEERDRRRGRRKVDPEAYDLVMRARAHIYEFTRDGMRKARELLDRAIAVDPDLATAYAALAIVHNVEYANGWTDDGARHLDDALALAERARVIDPDEPQAHYALALTLMWRRDLDAALQSAERAIELDPNFAGAHTARGSILDFAGEPESAVENLRTALRLDPEYDAAMQFLARALFSLRRYEEAEAGFRKRLLRAPKSDMARVFLASVYGHLGRQGEGQKMWRELREINPGFDVQRLREVFPYRDTSWFDHLMNGLRAAGLPD